MFDVFHFRCKVTTFFVYTQIKFKKKCNLQQKQPAEASCLREESNPLFADQGTLYVVLYAVLDDDELTVAEHFYSLQRCNYFLEVG